MVHLARGIAIVNPLEWHHFGWVLIQASLPDIMLYRRITLPKEYKPSNQRVQPYPGLLCGPDRNFTVVLAARNLLQNLTKPYF